MLKYFEMFDEYNAGGNIVENRGFVVLLPNIHSIVQAILKQHYKGDIIWKHVLLKFRSLK